MTQQLDIYSQAEALKQQGMAVATAAQPQEWKDRVDAVIETLALLGRPFTSDDVSAAAGDSPTGSQGAMGARMNAAAMRKPPLIRKVDEKASGRRSVHGKTVGVWIGA